MFVNCEATGEAAATMQLRQIQLKFHVSAPVFIEE